MITNQQCLDEIQRLHHQFGKVTKPILKDHATVSYEAVVRRFGNMANALLAAGIEPGPGQRKMISKEEVIDDLQRIAQQFGYISKGLYEKHGKFNTKVIPRIFGSWNEAYHELGTEPHPSGYIPTRLELTQELQRLNQEHGLVTSAIIRDFGKFSVTTYHERFTSLNLAYEFAGLPTREPGSCSHADWVIRRFAVALHETPVMEQRFDWLRNPKTGRHLPVDGFFPEHGIVVEYNGPQHYHVMPRYTPTEDALQYRQKLDNLKYQLIREHSLKLIVIDYRDSFTQEYIQRRLSEA